MTVTYFIISYNKRVVGYGLCNMVCMVLLCHSSAGVDGVNEVDLVHTDQDVE